MTTPLSTARLQEMADSVNPGPYLRELANEVLALRVAAEQIAWLQNYHADVMYGCGTCAVRGWDRGEVVYGFGSNLTQAVDDAMRRTGGKA